MLSEIDQRPPIVTVVVPIYAPNAQSVSLLGLALKSTMGQTLKNWQALVMDDASPMSGIKELVNSLNDDRISYVRNPKNLHQAGNWNAGKARVNTPYFCILQADDELKPNYLEKMIHALNEHPEVAAAHCQADIINERGAKVTSFVDLVKTFLHPHKKKHVLEGETGLCQLLRGNFIMCPTMFFRTASVSDLSFSAQSLYIVDWEFWCLMLPNDLKIMSLPEKHFRYRRHGLSATAESRKADLVFREEAAFMERTARAAQLKGWHRAAATAQKMRITIMRTLYFLFFDLLTFRWADSAQKARLLAQLSAPTSEKNR